VHVKPHWEREKEGGSGGATRFRGGEGSEGGLPFFCENFEEGRGWGERGGGQGEIVPQELSGKVLEGLLIYIPNRCEKGKT